MKLSEQSMNAVFEKMLFPEERSLCGVYCGFPQTGFFARPGNMLMGYATCTSFGRLLIARYFLKECATGTLGLVSAKKLTIKKNIFGQQIIEATFPIDNKELKLKLQISPKVYGVDFPNQEQNLATMLTILQKYETSH